jgi:outer membrane protein
MSRRVESSLRKACASGLCLFWLGSPAAAQQNSIAPVRPSAPILWRPYSAALVPPVRLGNSSRLPSLMRAGMLYLTVQDAIALALENNVDIEIARYSPLASDWQIERAEAGGALPGVPSAAAQASSVASGQGVLGSEAAAGVSINGAGGTRTVTPNATVSQIGPITQTLDPSIQETTSFSHRTLPQADSLLSSVVALTEVQRSYTASYQQGYLTGGSVTVSYSNFHLSENAPTDLLNPSVAPTASIQFQHNLLQGFGVAVNGRNITIAKMNRKISDLSFKTQVVGVVVNVLNTYYALAADHEQLQAKNSALATAQQFLDETRERVRLGTMLPLDVTAAQSQVASARRDLVTVQTSLAQSELALKNLISRTGVADPMLRAAAIMPLDKLTIPERDNLPPLRDLVQTALANRSDLAAEKANIAVSEVSLLGTKNGLLPSAQVFGSTSNKGLAGTAHTVVSPLGVERPDPYFVGGIGTALGQIFRRNFPSQSGGAFFAAPIGNNQAQADHGIDQLQLRQSQLAAQKDVNQAQVDILNSVIAMQQSRATYESAAKNRVLAEELLVAEQKKLGFGASFPYNVILQQRDLAAAQAAEILALASYTEARISLDQTLGTTLESNHISIQEALEGSVKR